MALHQWLAPAYSLKIPPAKKCALDCACCLSDLLRTVNEHCCTKRDTELLRISSFELPFAVCFVHSADNSSTTVLFIFYTLNLTVYKTTHIDCCTDVEQEVDGRFSGKTKAAFRLPESLTDMCHLWSLATSWNRTVVCSKMCEVDHPVHATTCQGGKWLASRGLCSMQWVSK